MSNSGKKKELPRLSVDMKNATLSNAVIKTKETLRISKTKALEILALEGWKALNGKPESSLVWMNNENPNSYELTSKQKAVSQLKINIIHFYQNYNASDPDSKILSGITITPRSCMLTIRNWIRPEEIYIHNRNRNQINYKLFKEIIQKEVSPSVNFQAQYPLPPEAILFFATQADANFYCEPSPNDLRLSPNLRPVSLVNSDDYIFMKIDIRFTYIPIYKKYSCEKTLANLDFDKIEYRSFKDVATKGWRYGKYSHYFYIDDVNLFRGGGYFIGLTREPCESYFDVKSGYHVPEYFTTPDGGLSIPYKLFLEGMSMKISGKGLKLVNEKIIENKKRSFNSQKS